MHIIYIFEFFGIIELILSQFDLEQTSAEAVTWDVSTIAEFFSAHEKAQTESAVFISRVFFLPLKDFLSIFFISL